MDRITVKLDRDTHQRLIAAMPELSTEAGRMLTIPQAIGHLLDCWARDDEYEIPASWAGLTADQVEERMHDLAQRFSGAASRVSVQEWAEAMRNAGRRRMGG